MNDSESCTESNSSDSFSMTAVSLGLTMFLLVSVFGCGEYPSDLGFKHPSKFPYSTLSEYDFFNDRLVDLSPRDGVIPYQVVSPLWADHAGKARFLVLPAGTKISPSGSEDWQFPTGTVIIKNFFYSKNLSSPEESIQPIETRLLIKEASDWTGHTYVWNEALTDAVRKVSGKRLTLNYTDLNGESMSQEYVVPNTNQCKDCHERDYESRPLGFVGRQLHREVKRDGESVSQLDWLNAAGVFSQPVMSDSSEVLVDPFGEASVEKRARSYLDANCSHCHRDGGNGGPSGLVLLASETRPRAYGVCKGPVAAGDGTGGFYNDIYPGRPEESIMIHRMKSTDPEIKMPEIPNRLPHQAGIDLVSQWIAEMPEMVCD